MAGHHHIETPPKPTQREMAEAMLPMGCRDACANWLIPLNECRRKTLYMPWKCTELRHAYEKCQYKEFNKRVEAKKEQLQKA